MLLILINHLQAFAQTPVLNSYSPAAATVYLDFDGAEVEGTIWNEKGKIIAEPSGLSPATITWIHKMIADHFKLFNLNITTDPAVYERAPCISASGSLLHPTEAGMDRLLEFLLLVHLPGETIHPAWVFMNALSDNPSFIAAAATHQIGHTLGLQHQSVYDSYGSYDHGTERRRNQYFFQ